MRKALETAKDKFGRVDVAVSCAGIGIAAVTYNPKKDTIHQLDDFMKVVTVRITHSPNHFITDQRAIIEYVCCRNGTSCNLIVTGCFI